MMEPERVLTELAERLFRGGWSLCEIKAILAPYLPKPEPDPLTLAARECWNSKSEAQIRAIIAREVAAAQPSDEVLQLRDALQQIAEFYTDTDLAAKHMVAIARASLKREGA